MTLLVIFGGLLAVGLAWAYGTRHVDTGNQLAIVALLAGFASAFNVVVPVPNIEATTTVVVCTTLVLGMRSGMLVGMVSIVATGVIGGLGLWTVWQMLGFVLVAGVAGVVADAARRGGVDLARQRAALGALVGILVVLYDVTITVPSLHASGMVPSGGVLAVLLVGLPFTMLHVVGSVVVTMVAGPALLRALQRAAHRLGAPSGRRLPAR